MKAHQGSVQHLHSLAANIKERLDVEVVGSEDDLEEHFLVDLDELCVPVRDVGGTPARLFGIVGGSGRVAAVVRAVLENLGGAKVMVKSEP